ncbi:FMRFamide receptor-like [Physella acuta]|uniref:FMRFamide receptor-like n=1 Tax=Physella acuta TaxID=109671 RepID=UPI0027DE799C|nr:FMRFamide receptor-like [Physella acuta]
MEDAFFAQAHKIGYGYVLNLLCVVGILGNVLVLLVLSQQRAMTSSNAVHYLRLLALADICVLAFAVGRYRYPLFCMKSRWNPVSVYLLTAACTHGVAGLVCPLIFSKEVNHVTYLNMTVAVVEVTEFGRSSMYECSFNQFVIPLIWYIIPWCVMVVINTMLYIEVQKSSQLRVDLPDLPQPNRKLSLLIVLVVFLHMTCNFPRCMVAVYNLAHPGGHRRHDGSSTCGPGSQSSAYAFITVVSNILNVMNSCINIIVYCGCGSKFRQELRHFLTCRICKNRVSPISSVATHHVTALAGTNLK